MKRKSEDLIKENEKLIIEIEVLRIKEQEREKTFHKLVEEKVALQERTQNAVLKEKELQTLITTWERIVDEMAHSINTDVFAALSNLNDIDDNRAVNKAKHNIKRIRDIANLLMWDLNKTRLPVSTTILEINLYHLIQTQIDAIRDGIDSLRLSVREHKDKLFQLIIPVNVKSECIIQIDDNIETGLELIIKDLLRNAFQNTDEENPLISVEMFSTDDFISLTITNNQLISEKELRWFNEGIEGDDIQMSKSAKVGLRLVKRWLKNLRINGKFVTNSKPNRTSIELQIPKVIKYEKI